jgi:hypothetical protein
MADISSVGYTADLLAARYQIATDRTRTPETVTTEQTRVQELRDMLERAGAQPDQARLERGVGDRLDILV